MSALSQEAVLAALRQVNDPDLHRDVVSLGFVKDLTIDGGRVSFTLDLTTPACPVKDQLQEQARAAVAGLPGAEEVEVRLSASVRPMSATYDAGQLVAESVRNVILVASGKGGVGKSTVAVNLAAALSRLGAKVGLLDADVYGPSVPTMLGIRDERPTSSDGRHLDPILAHGLKTMSIGYLVEADQAMIWRGPMLTQALTQFLRDVNWGELDYLVLDLPPGTGDVQLTLAQQVRSAAALLVTTPQDVALADVRRAKGMFDRVQIPILGVVENMSYFACPHCGEETAIFDRGGGEAFAGQADIAFLGAVPLHLRVRESGDRGLPVVLADPEGAEARVFLEIAGEVARRVSVEAAEAEKSTPTLRMAP